MDFKEFSSFLKFFESQDPLAPKVLLVSGSDLQLGELVIKKVQKVLHNQFSKIEMLIFTEEDKEESNKLKMEIQQASLFMSSRFILVRRAEKILGNILESKIKTNKNENSQLSLNSLAPQTIMLFLYEGTPTKTVLNFLDSSLTFLHFITQKLYPNQIEEALRRALHQRGIKLNDTVFFYLIEHLEPRVGMIEHIAEKLHDFYRDKKDSITIDEVKMILFPFQGWDLFSFIDALFSNNFSLTLREIKRYNPKSDNLFVVLKLILKRLDEIRFAHCAFKIQMNEKELISHLGLSYRPPFIQKKTIARLRSEVPRFPAERRLSLYHMLIEMQKKFRLEASEEGNQMIYFQQKLVELFFMKK